MSFSTTFNIFHMAYEALMCENPFKKCILIDKLYNTICQQKLKPVLDFTKSLNILDIDIPGRPAKPELVLPKFVARRRLSTFEGQAALLHAICHIEFNAINLALDAVYRFQDMPFNYYLDWLKIASEEAKHFNLLREYLIDLGYDYGSFLAHNGLWEMAQKTRSDVLVRMALVPRVMEARGLDVTPGIIDKFKQIKDNRAVEILTLILEEEQGHVACGNKWYNYLCAQRGIDPFEKFKELVKKYAFDNIKPPINNHLRLNSGFTVNEIEFLNNFSGYLSNKAI
jgi:uncharacterized ferritin-like protein (DUF455 family)